MCKVIDFYRYLDEIAPFSAQEAWDNSGFLVGDGEARVTKVLVALDATEEVLCEAAEKGAELVITHHPVIFSPLKELHPSDMAYVATQKGVAVISSHTALDVADGGVNDCLAAALGLQNIRKCKDEAGLLRVGVLPEQMELPEFISYVAEKLGVGGIKYTPAEKPIKTVAVCGGSGAEFYPDAVASGADAYVTANVKHNWWIEIRRAGFCVLDAGHHCTENTVIVPLAKRLSERFPETEILISERCKDPALYWTK
ncbi:MAG TPA: Nif3-like dinuclear metal center hexameric protein [Oscillospiraceae bacterium]|nr:Nif3-like dinuclear metal center hexameric protein [Oscillospiraceae bacterium]